MPTCHCLICADEAAPFRWRVVIVAPQGDGRPFAFTVGLWHWFRSPEVAVFGRSLGEMSGWLEVVGEQASAGRRLHPDQCPEDILGTEVVVPRPVVACWHRHLFAPLLEFYRGQPVPIVQLVWADGAGQPRLWEWRDHDSIWGSAPDPPDWTFPVPPDTLVVTSEPVAFAGVPATAVVHDEDGEWEFLDGSSDDPAVVHLAHLVALDPDLAVLADLPAGWEARRIDGTGWRRVPLEEE